MALQATPPPKPISLMDANERRAYFNALAADPTFPARLDYIADRFGVDLGTAEVMRTEVDARRMPERLVQA